MSTAEYEAKVAADIRRVASACETANDLAAAHQRIAADLRDLTLRRYEYERLQEGIFVERQRTQRHHDVLCLVLKELVRARVAGAVEGRPHIYADNALTVEAARVIADLAYPPPKAE